MHFGTDEWKISGRRRRSASKGKRKEGRGETAIAAEWRVASGGVVRPASLTTQKINAFSAQVTREGGREGGREGEVTPKKDPSSHILTTMCAIISSLT